MTTGPPNAERHTANAAPERPAILVVEDDPALRDLLCTLLEMEGYDPQGATDGADALRRLAGGWMPAAITLDLRMPTLNGWDFLEQYNARAEPPPRAPVLVVTAIPANGHHLHVAGVMSKPFRVDALLARIGELAPLPHAA